MGQKMLRTTVLNFITTPKGQNILNVAKPNGCGITLLPLFVYKHFQQK